MVKGIKSCSEVQEEQNGSTTKLPKSSKSHQQLWLFSHCFSHIHCFTAVTCETVPDHLLHPGPFIAVCYVMAFFLTSQVILPSLEKRVKTMHSFLTSKVKIDTSNPIPYQCQVPSRDSNPMDLFTHPPTAFQPHLPNSQRGRRRNTCLLMFQNILCILEHRRGHVEMITQ